MSKVTVSTVINKKGKEKIVALTAYDAQIAKILDELGVDIILVGDSVGNVKLGYENTIPVRLEEMVHHAKAVRRAVKNALLVVDMPYLTYEVDPKEAAKNAGILVKEAGAEAVKLEGGLEVGQAIKEILKLKIPVMGHIGLTPTAVYKIGGYRVCGRTEEEKEKLITEAKILEGSGCFSIVIEAVVEEVAKEITEKVLIPTIGIGAGRFTDGQILVVDDLIGITENPPKFVKKYADVRSIIINAVSSYISDVRNNKFPEERNIYK
ncbi:MAG: 3-methyl-2-oxobutanoate hydroxymethyltransferase [bacterium]|nr:3-methyl-2-oxobutanoate hydroxymethyltransferase [bacterium]